MDYHQLVAEPATAPLAPSTASYPGQARNDAPGTTSQDMLEGMSLDQEPFISLNWPDSEDLLNSILSTEFVNLPSLESLPSQYIVRGDQQAEPQPVSPWLTSDSSQSHVHGGNHAVRNLSQMINSMVDFLCLVVEHLLTVQVRRCHIHCSESRAHASLSRWMPSHVLYPICA